MNPAWAHKHPRLPASQARSAPRAAAREPATGTAGGEPNYDPTAEALWIEHGWSLTGWQVSALLAAVTAVSGLLHYLT